MYRVTVEYLDDEGRVMSSGSASDEGDTAMTVADCCRRAMLAAGFHIDNVTENLGPFE